MKILIIYFSGTGNTKKIAELYKASFEARGDETELLSLPEDIDRVKTANGDGYEAIGFGYPIHSFNAPRIMLDACKALPERESGRMRAFIFKTSGEPVRMSDVSSLKMRAILRSRGYDVDNEYQHLMPYNIIFRHSDAMAHKMWETAKALVPVCVSEIKRGVRCLPEKMFMGAFLAWILRIEHPGAHINGLFYKANERCVRCGLCEKRCPVGNIKIENGNVKFGGKCIMCMRCSLFCPANAVEIGLFRGWKVNGEYSLAPPDENAPQDEHENYCKNAYERYFAAAQAKIDEYNEYNEKRGN